MVKLIWRWFPLRKQFNGCGAGKLKRTDLYVSAKYCRRSIWRVLNSALQSTRARFRERSKLCQKDHLFFPPPLLKSSQVRKCWLTKPTVERKWQRKLNASNEVYSEKVRVITLTKVLMGPFTVTSFFSRLIHSKQITGYLRNMFLTCWCFDLLASFNKPINCSPLWWQSHPMKTSQWYRALSPAKDRFSFF